MPLKLMYLNIITQKKRKSMNFQKFMNVGILGLIQLLTIYN